MQRNDQQRELVKTAKVTGIWYLLLAISGILGFLVVHPKVYSSDPETTLSNLTDSESLARLRLVLELVLVISQALAALWFYKLFRRISDWKALGVGIWGTMNSAVIMISAISMASAIQIAHSSAQSFEDKIVLVELLGQLIKHSWIVGGLFFGLWLLPMGQIAVRSKRFPIWMGRILMLGGAGYILSTLLYYAGFIGSWLDVLTIPATIGEFWMIGYLLVYGIRPGNET